MIDTVVPSVVRVAGPQDHQEVWRLLLQGHSENGVLPLSVQKVEWFVSRFLNPQAIPPGDMGPRGAIGVIGPVGALQGITLLMLSGFWYSDVPTVDELIVYVDPDFRRSNHAKALLHWNQEQVAAIGLPLFTGIMSSHRTEAKCALYRRMLPKIGELFLVLPSSMSVSASSSALAA